MKFKVWDKKEKRMIYPDSPGQQHFFIALNGQFSNLQNGSGGDDYLVMIHEESKRGEFEAMMMGNTYDNPGLIDL